ncbi:MAG TPA: queuosine salvage family protein [Thermoleophilaceae bacterium]|nr:queuosine salvage family protein [Thermoleophilaceae bacterium]
MGLCEEVRASCAAIAESARDVAIDLSRVEAIEVGPEPVLDPERHYLEGSAEDVAMFTLTLDAINFGSGWFPTLRKRPGCSGYNTIAWALTDRFRAEGPWAPDELATLDADTVADVLGQERGHELMGLYAEALRQLGAFIGGRTALEVVAAANGSAELLAEQLASGMPLFDDPGFYKRAQIVASDLTLAGVAEFADIDRLTIFADNLVPHVLRVDGVLRYSAALAAAIDSEALLPPGAAEREIRACAVVACEAIAADLGVPPRVLDNWLWNRGQQPRYKAIPRHRTRTTAY